MTATPAQHCTTSKRPPLRWRARGICVVAFVGCASGGGVVAGIALPGLDMQPTASVRPSSACRSHDTGQHKDERGLSSGGASLSAHDLSQRHVMSRKGERERRAHVCRLSMRRTHHLTGTPRMHNRLTTDSRQSLASGEWNAVRPLVSLVREGVRKTRAASDLP